jgi:hypothetical protein
MADNLLGAVIEVWAADPTLAQLVPGGLVLEEYDPGAPLPHAALFDEGGTDELQSEGAGVETRRLRVEVYASRDAAAPPEAPGEAGEAVNRILERARAVLNAGRLSVSGRAHTLLRASYPVPAGERLRAVPQRDAQGRRVYQGLLGLVAQVSRPP